MNEFTLKELTKMFQDMCNYGDGDKIVRIDDKPIISIGHKNATETDPERIVLYTTSAKERGMKPRNWYNVKKVEPEE